MKKNNLDLDKVGLKKFGITMAIAFLVITALILIKHKYSIAPTLTVSLLFFILAIAMPLALNPLYICWMRLARILSWVNTRLILAVLFYLVFTPIGIILRILSKDLLGRRIDKSASTYWNKKEACINSYERQF